MESDSGEKRKVIHLIEGVNHSWEPGRRREYMNKLTRKQTSALFKARTRMLDVKNNFRGKYPDTERRMCKREIETQKHILEECSAMHTSDESK